MASHFRQRVGFFDPKAWIGVQLTLPLRIGRAAPRISSAVVSLLIVSCHNEKTRQPASPRMAAERAGPILYCQTQPAPSIHHPLISRKILDVLVVPPVPVRVQRSVRKALPSKGQLPPYKRSDHTLSLFSFPRSSIGTVWYYDIPYIFIPFRVFFSLSSEVPPGPIVVRQL